MNTALWIVQGVLAAVFLMAGSMKALRSKEQLAPKMAYVEDFSAGSIRAIGLAEVVGAVGLVVPWLTGVLPRLTPLAAACLVVLMLGAVYTHVRRHETAMAAAPVVLGLLTAFVAWGRYVA